MSRQGRWKLEGLKVLVRSESRSTPRGENWREAGLRRERRGQEGGVGLQSGRRQAAQVGASASPTEVVKPCSVGVHQVLCALGHCASVKYWAR